MDYFFARRKLILKPHNVLT